MEYVIKYGSFFAIDQFGFVGKGRINIDGLDITLSGKKHWSTLSQIGIFFLLSFVLGPLFALLIVHYFCASPASLKFSLSDIREVKRSGKKITFLAPDKNSNKIKKSIFSGLNEEEAEEIEKALTGYLISISREKQKIQGVEEESITKPNEQGSYNFCPNCGAKIEADSRFCTKCGNKISIP